MTLSSECFYDKTFQNELTLALVFHELWATITGLKHFTQNYLENDFSKHFLYFVLQVITVS